MYIYICVCIGLTLVKHHANLMIVRNVTKDSEAVLGVWRPAPLPTSRAPP